MDKKTKVEILQEKNFKVIRLKDGQKYYFNNKLFIVSTIIILAIAVGLLIEYKDMKNHYYIECVGNAQCFNEYYNNVECGKTFPIDSKICTQQYFMPGETEGEKPPMIVSSALEMTIIFLLVVFAFNHVMYNRRFKLKIDLGDNK